MPERHPLVEDACHGIAQFFGTLQGEGAGYVAFGVSGAYPGADHYPPTALRADHGTHFLTPYGPALAAGKYHVGRDHVLAQPAVLEGADPEAVLGQPAPDGGPRCARGIDRQASPAGAQLVV